MNRPELARYLFHHQEHDPRPVDHAVAHLHRRVPVRLRDAAGADRDYRVPVAQPGAAL